MPLHSVYVERDDENEAPPSRVMKISFSTSGRDTQGEFVEPVVWFGIGDFEESTFQDVFKSPAEQQFSVTLHDLIRAMVGLGIVTGVELAKGVELYAGQS